MRRVLSGSLLAACMVLLLGCTNTVKGIQQDSSNVWHGTKQVIHEATAEE